MAAHNRAASLQACAARLLVLEVGVPHGPLRLPPTPLVQAALSVALSGLAVIEETRVIAQRSEQQQQTVWCSQPSCVEHYHTTSSGMEGSLMPNGWVLAREDGEPMRPDMAGERTARLVPFCPMHSQPPTVEDTKVWHELVEACVALRPLRVLPAHQRLGDRDVARRWDRWYAAVNAAWDKLTD